MDNYWMVQVIKVYIYVQSDNAWKCCEEKKKLWRMQIKTNKFELYGVLIFFSSFLCK